MVAAVQYQLGLSLPKIVVPVRGHLSLILDGGYGGFWWWWWQQVVDGDWACTGLRLSGIGLGMIERVVRGFGSACQMGGFAFFQTTQVQLNLLCDTPS